MADKPYKVKHVTVAVEGLSSVGEVIVEDGVLTDAASLSCSGRVLLIVIRILGSCVEKV